MTHSKLLSCLRWQQKICFRSFVDRVLLHNEVTYVQRLHLRLGEQDDDFYMKAWLNAIAKREIREINIFFFYHETRQVVPLVLPTKFLSMESLVVLKLHGEFAIDDPISLCLPKLEIIHLTGILFPNHVFMKRLSSGCPVLKELFISDCSGITNTLYVESPTLKKLDIMYTVKKTQQACIVIKTPNLKHLRIEDDLKQQVVGELSSVVEANLDFECYDDDEYVLQLVRKVSGVRTLRLESDQWAVYESQLPIFQNLNCLKLFDSYNIYKLLQSAPRLKTLVFEDAYGGDNSYESKPLPKCL